MHEGLLFRKVKYIDGLDWKLGVIITVQDRPFDVLCYIKPVGGGISITRFLTQLYLEA